MLGIWEKPKEEIQSRHFAFNCNLKDVIENAVPFLLQKGIQPYNFLKDGTVEPMVFTWMPAIAIYFKNPDGHSLEFIAIFDGEAKPRLGVVTDNKWLSMV